tara:strand:+ start:342 stop:1964 length:1623 start_codon:yes stop_codon:yes gene_type:complete
MNFLLKSNVNESSYPTNEKDWKPYFQKLIQDSKYLDTSIVNGIRRYSISKINTVAFDYSPTPMLKEYIYFDKNNSNMNNDFIGHRLGLLPNRIVGVKYLLLIYKILISHTDTLNKILNLLKDEKNKNTCIKMLKQNLKLNDNIDLISKIKFYISEKNENLDVMPITSEHIKIAFMDPNNPESEINLPDVSAFNEIFKLYEEYNQIEESIYSDISYNKLIRLTFPLFNFKEENYGVLLCKLKKNETLRCRMYLNIGSGEKHSRWSVVSPCTYSFELDPVLINDILLKKCQKITVTNANKLILLESELEKLIGSENNELLENLANRYNNMSEFTLNPTSIKEKQDLFESELFTKLDQSKQEIVTQFISEKDKLLNTFNKCDKQRYFKGKEEFELFKRQFNLYIESIGYYDSERILYKTYKLLMNDVIDICDNIIYLFKNYSNYPLKNNLITIDESDKIENGIDILFNNSNHAIGNILTSYIYYLYDNSDIKYIAYKMVHPLKQEMIMTIGLENRENVNTKLYTIFNNLKNIFSNMKLENYTN